MTRTFLVLIGSSLSLLMAACGGTSTTTVYPSADAATVILAPVERWNPVPGQPRQHGNAARGDVVVVNGRIVHSEQTYTVWTQSGGAPPASVERLKRRHYEHYRRAPSSNCWYRGDALYCQ